MTTSARCSKTKGSNTARHAKATEAFTSRGPRGHVEKRLSLPPMAVAGRLSSSQCHVATKAREKLQQRWRPRQSRIAPRTSATANQLIAIELNIRINVNGRNVSIGCTESMGGTPGTEGVTASLNPDTGNARHGGVPTHILFNGMGRGADHSRVDPLPPLADLACVS